MGSVGSSLLKSSQSASNLDWIGPSTSQRLPAKRHRFASLFAYRYVSDSLLRFNSRRKNRPISRETQRAFKDLISSWSCSELAALCTEMESSWALRELVILAESARPPVLSISDYLSKALDDRIACDAFIVFKNKRYDVHSSILLARCQYFSEQYALLSKPNGPGPFEISLPELEISNELFEAFLRYIYTGKIINVPKHEQGILNEILSRLRCGQSLEENLANFDFERNGDCTLVFTTNDSYSSDKVGRRNDSRDYFVQCSSVMMTARSDFFRSIIKRKQQNDEPLTIVIDEHLFPRVYAPVILHAIYTGRLDLSKTMDGCPVSTNSLNEVQAIASGRRQRSPLRQAIDVYQISRFLNLYFLAQACEDVMVSELSADTLSGLWSWSSEPDGSAYVKRQCIAYLRGEFSRICSSYLLYELDEDLLYECLLSDYVQCSEVEILECLIRWGEHELVRRMEEREPNLVANTTHSISRKGVRRSELNDDELKHILKQLLALVRTDYILPPFHQSLNNAYKRGLLERSSSGDLLGQRYPDSRSPDINPDAHWFDQTVPKRHSAGPRLLAPYVMEARHQLRRLCGNSAEVMASWMSNASMNNEMDKHLSAFYINVHFGISDVVSNEQLVKIKERVRNLINANIWVKKALLCGCEYHRKCTIEQIRLCALRQLGLDENLISIEWETMTPAASFTNREASSSQSSLTFSTISNYVGTGVVQPGRNGKMECCQPDILQKECDISSLGCH